MIYWVSVPLSLLDRDLEGHLSFPAVDCHGFERVVEYFDYDVVDRALPDVDRDARLREPLQSIVRLGD
jgi:hypothetical protein